MPRDLEGAPLEPGKQRKPPKQKPAEEPEPEQVKLKPIPYKELEEEQPEETKKVVEGLYSHSDSGFLIGYRFYIMILRKRVFSRIILYAEGCQNLPPYLPFVSHCFDTPPPSCPQVSGS